MIYVERCLSPDRQPSLGRKTIRELAPEKGLFTEDQLDVILSPQQMTHPGIAGLSVMEESENQE